MTDLPTGWSGWIAAGIVGVISALTTAVSVLYKKESAVKDRELLDVKAREAALTAMMEQRKKEHREDVDKLRALVEECQRDREEIRVQLAKVMVRVEMLEAKYLKDQEQGGKVDRGPKRLEE